LNISEFIYIPLVNESSENYLYCCFDNIWCKPHNIYWVHRGFSAYFGKRSLVILGIFIHKNAQFGNFCIDKMVHFGKILCAPILLNQFIFLYQYTEINTSYSPCERQKLLQGMRSCNGAIIAGPDQSLPARIKFRSKFT